MPYFKKSSGDDSKASERKPDMAVIVASPEGEDMEKTARTSAMKDFAKALDAKDFDGMDAAMAAHYEACHGESDE